MNDPRASGKIRRDGVVMCRHELSGDRGMSRQQRGPPIVAAGAGDAAVFADGESTAQPIPTRIASRKAGAC
jgi:hypothetical protein